MKFRNLDDPRRIRRIAIGGVLLAIGWWDLGPSLSFWAVPLRVVALYPLLTGLAGWCPMKSLLR